MPEFPKAAPKKLIDMPFTATPQQIQHGEILFTQYCGTCHFNFGGGGGTIPDLAYSSDAIHKIFKDILLQGPLEKNGMPNFSGKLSESDISDIHNYILATAKKQIEKRKNVK